MPTLPRSSSRYSVLRIAGIPAWLLIAACTGAPAATAPATPVSGASSLATPAPTVVAPGPTVTPTAPPEAGATFATTIESSTEAPDGAITIEMGPDARPAFQPRVANARAGSVILFITNVDPVAQANHNFLIGTRRGVPAAGTAALRRGESVVMTLSDVPAGTYTFWCDILRHWEFGMEGTLNVAD